MWHREFLEQSSSLVRACICTLQIVIRQYHAVADRVQVTTLHPQTFTSLLAQHSVHSLSVSLSPCLCLSLIGKLTSCKKVFNSPVLFICLLSCSSISRMSVRNSLIFLLMGPKRFPFGGGEFSNFCEGSDYCRDAITAVRLSLYQRRICYASCHQRALL